MKKYIIIIFLFNSGLGFSAQLTPDDYVVGTYTLHFNQQGEVIEPDEYYFFHGVNDEADGFKNSARKQFQRAASYGNTFGFYYTGLLYLQEAQNIKGYAWLSMVDTQNFPYAANVKDLLFKLESGFDQNAMQQAKDYITALDEYYGVEATFQRRLKWSKNFKLTGSHIKGHIPNSLSIQTDWTTSDSISKFNTNLSAKVIENSIKSFVYEYDMDFRIREGNVNVKDIELIESASKK